jgi:hypothetical protein
MNCWRHFNLLESHTTLAKWDIMAFAYSLRCEENFHDWFHICMDFEGKMTKPITLTLLWSSTKQIHCKKNAHDFTRLLEFWQCKNLIEQDAWIGTCSFLLYNVIIDFSGFNYILSFPWKAFWVCFKSFVRVIPNLSTKVLQHGLKLLISIGPWVVEWLRWVIQS